MSTLRIIIGIVGITIGVVAFIASFIFPKSNDSELPPDVASLPIYSGLRAEYVESQQRGGRLLFLAAFAVMFTAILELLTAIL